MNSSSNLHTRDIGGYYEKRANIYFANDIKRAPMGHWHFKLLEEISESFHPSMISLRIQEYQWAIARGLAYNRPPDLLKDKQGMSFRQQSNVLMSADLKLIEKTIRDGWNLPPPSNHERVNIKGYLIVNRTLSSFKVTWNYT